MLMSSLRLPLSLHPRTDEISAHRVGFPCSPALNRKTEVSPVKGAARRSAMALRATPDGGYFCLGALLIGDQGKECQPSFPSGGG